VLATTAFIGPFAAGAGVDGVVVLPVPAGEVPGVDGVGAVDGTVPPVDGTFGVGTFGPVSPQAASGTAAATTDTRGIERREERMGPLSTRNRGGNREALKR